MIKSIIGIFANWQVKLAIGFLIVVSAFAWHKYEVKVAVNEATTAIEYNYAKENLRLREREQQANAVIQKDLEARLKDKDEKLKNTTTQYNDLTAWVRNQPKRATSTSSDSGNSPAAESSPGDAIGELYRKNAYDLAEYAKTTESLKVYLNACYADYSAIKQIIDAFRSENAPRIDFKAPRSD